MANKNWFKEILDIEECKKQIAACPEGEVVILIPHYSINVQSKYAGSEAGDDIDNDWNDLEEELDTTLEVNQFDDLVANPHGLEL
jgi:hypothetical protein